MTTAKRHSAVAGFRDSDQAGPRSSIYARPKGLSVDRQAGQVIQPLPVEIPPVSNVRSTLLASSLQVIRERGLSDAYVDALPVRYHDQVLRTLAPVWLPIDAAMAHYRAIDSLRLPEEDVFAIGRSVGDRLHGTFLGTLLRGVRQAGVTPWHVASKVDRVWSRVFVGGAIGVVRLGPKEGVLSVRGLPLLVVDYFRVGWRGVISTSLEAIVHRCYIRETGRRSESDAIDFLVSWV